MFEEFSFETRDCLIAMRLKNPGVFGDRIMRVLLLRAKGLTLDAIGKKIGVSRERVRQLLETAILRFNSVSNPPKKYYRDDKTIKIRRHEEYYRQWYRGEIECVSCLLCFEVEIPPNFNKFYTKCPACGQKIVLQKYGGKQCL